MDRGEDVDGGWKAVSYRNDGKTFASRYRANFKFFYAVVKRNKRDAAWRNSRGIFDAAVADKVGLKILSAVTKKK